MKKLNVLNYGIGLLAAFALIAVLLITSVEAVVYWTPGYFEREYEKHRVLDDVHMEMDELLKVTDHMMAYLRGGEEELQITAEIGGVQRGFFNAREIAHMEDVRELFLGGLRLRYFALTVTAVCLLTLYKRKAMRVLPKTVIAGAGIFISGAALLAAAASSDFTKYFTIFHHIFFDNDLWILNPQTDLLINIVPEPFFVDTALRIGIIFAAALSAAVGISVVFLKKERRAEKTAKKALQKETEGEMQRTG